MADLNENLTLPLVEAKLPGRILSNEESIGATLDTLCKMTAYDLSQLKGVGSSVVDATREILSFYGLHLSGDTRTDYYTGEEHPEVASYRTRLAAKHPGMVEKLGTLSDREVGEEFGVSAQAINNHRRKLGIAKAKRAKAKKAHMVWMERAEILSDAINAALALPFNRAHDMRGLLDAALAEAQADTWVEDATTDTQETEAATDEADATEVVEPEVVAATANEPTPDPTEYPAPPAPPAGFEGAMPPQWNDAPVEPVECKTEETFDFSSFDV